MLKPIEEANFAKLRAMCRELKAPAPPEVFIGLKVHDKDGVLVFDDIQRGHSWTRNFWNCFYGFLANYTSGTGAFGAGNLNYKTLGGTIVSNGMRWTSSYSGYIRLADGDAASAVTGIVVGTGDTAFSLEQYVLAALIAHGNGAGQFAYSAHTPPVGAYTAGTKTWAISYARIFNNNSGSSITIKEVGFIGRDGTFNFTALFERSVLAPPVAVANGAQLTVTYEISMDFSAID